MGKHIDLTGKVFGRLTAICPAYTKLSSGRMMPSWMCVCTCGNETVVQGHHLRRGKTRSCGCRWRDEDSMPEKDVPEFGAWWQMVQRCTNPNVASYKYYGGRGIEVCYRWRWGDGERNGFFCFLADMGPRREGLSLDRIDPDGHYEPSNCRWATDAQQRTNTRRSIHAVIGGVKVPLKKYAARTGLDYERVRLRVRKRNETVCEAARGLLSRRAA